MRVSQNLPCDRQISAETPSNPSNQFSILKSKIPSFPTSYPAVGSYWSPFSFVWIFPPLTFSCYCIHAFFLLLSSCDFLWGAICHLYVSKHLSWLYILQSRTACFYTRFCGTFCDPVSSGILQASKRYVSVPLVLESQKKNYKADLCIGEGLWS